MDIHSKVSLLKGDIVVAQTYKRMKQKKMRAAQERQRRRQQEAQQKQKEKLKNFLEKHDFDPSDANAPGMQKTSCFGLIRFQQRPLHKAIENDETEVISLLILYGADPMSKDSKGKTAYDYVKSPLVKTCMQKLHARTSVSGALPLL